MTNWHDLTWFNGINFQKIELVRQIYTSVDDIDLFVAANFENKREGHRLSPVMECIIGEQFYRWKNGDRFWYEIEGQPHSFTPGNTKFNTPSDLWNWQMLLDLNVLLIVEQLDEIRKLTLSRVVCDTSDYIVNVTVNAWAPPSDK